MQPFSRAIMTDSGSRLFMKAQAGEAKIKFTKIAVGDGEYSGEERKISSQQIKTELKSLKNSYPISKIEVVSDHSVKVTALITNYDPISEEAVVENGYYINEMGLFAKESEDEDGETEVLYSIAIVEGETGDFMPPFDGNNPAQIIQEYYATVNNAEEVTIEMGKGAVALAEDLEKIMILDFDDSGEVEGIESFEDFMSSFVKGTNIYQFFSNLKAGLKYVLHTGKLVNSGMCETPGEFALDAAYGKTLQDKITELYSEIQGAIQMLKNDLSDLDTRVTNAINGGSLAPPFSYNWINSPYTNLVGSVISLFENTATSLKGGSRNHPSAGGSFNLGRNWSTGIAVKNGYKFVYDISNYSIGNPVLSLMDESNNVLMNMSGLSGTIDISALAGKTVHPYINGTYGYSANAVSKGYTFNNLTITNK